MKNMSEEKKPASDKEAKKEEKKITVPAKFKEIVEQIEKLSVLDLAELVKVLEEKFGVSAQAAVAVAAPGGGEEAASAAEEKTSFNVELTECGPNKIAVIKAVRELTQKGLKEAKDLVDAAPKVIKEGASKEEAGAKVTLK